MADKTDELKEFIEKELYAKKIRKVRLTVETPISEIQLILTDDFTEKKYKKYKKYNK